MSSLAQVFIAPGYPSWADRPFSLLVPKVILRRGGVSPFVALGPVRVERRFRMIEDPEELVLVRGRLGQRAICANLFDFSRGCGFIRPPHGGDELLDEDWELLPAFLPDDREAPASRSGALKGLRKDKSAESLLRVLPVHLGCGHSLRETVARARQSGLADLSDVAPMKRLKKARDWLRSLCAAPFLESGVALSAAGSGFQVRAFDATTAEEPGKTGSLRRIHYGADLPSLRRDHFGTARTEGAGSGESFLRFPIRDGDFVPADRGCSAAPTPARWS